MDETKNETQKKGLGLKRRILLPVLIAVVALIALSGVAYAGYQFWTANAEVEVQEAMAVYVDGGWEDSGAYTWDASMYPNTSASKGFIVRNNGTADLGIIPVVTPTSRNSGKITTSWSPAGKTTVQPGSGNQVTFTLTITAAGDATPNDYSFVISFERENP